MHLKCMAPTNNTMICAELACTICLVLAPHARIYSNHMPALIHQQSFAEHNLPSFHVKLSKQIISQFFTVFIYLFIYFSYFRTEIGS